MSDYNALLEKAIRDEEFYRFPTFSQDNIYELACDMLEAFKEFEEGSLALEIDLSGTTLFRYCPTGTGLFNLMWLNKKRNTVKLFEKSSLRVHAEIGLSGEDIEKDMGLNPKEYALYGGGFPIRLTNGCIIGFIGASGLEHTRDHAAVIAGLDRYFRRNFKELYK